MTADVDGDDILDSGAWGVFVARTVQEIRSEVGEEAANRVAAALDAQKSEAIEATREQQKATEAMLARGLEEVAEARRVHERIHAELDEWEAELVERVRERDAVSSPATPLSENRGSGWGRRRDLDDD